MGSKRRKMRRLTLWRNVLVLMVGVECGAYLGYAFFTQTFVPPTCIVGQRSIQEIVSSEERRNSTVRNKWR